MSADATLLASCELEARHGEGHFFAPLVYEIKELSQLPGEVFGPILHIILLQRLRIARCACGYQRLRLRPDAWGAQPYRWLRPGSF